MPARKTRKVSVVTATYNRADYLPLAIESVLGQTYRDIEYHIIDDGSRDDTRKVVERYLGDGRVRYYYQENRGQSAARNLGIRNSTGDFICFLDSDNIREPDKMEMQIRILDEDPDVDIVYGDGQCIDEQGRFISVPTAKKYSGSITEKLLISNFITNNTVMCRKKCFAEMGGFDEGLRYAEDYDLWLRFSTRYRFHYLPEKIARYRVWGNRLSEDTGNVFKANRLILERFLEQYPGSVSEGVKRKVWCRFYTGSGRGHASRREYGEAFGDYMKALSYGPLNPAPWRALLKMLLLWK
ncbi:MAG: glycosyltransferase [Deltaproteobacteria bacterium]|nr:glycosyltransferase [Deltaproteobacteria bacterium]